MTHSFPTSIDYYEPDYVAPEDSAPQMFLPVVFVMIGMGILLMGQFYPDDRMFFLGVPLNPVLYSLAAIIAHFARFEYTSRAIGLLVMQMARVAGAARILVSEPAPARARAARRLGAEAVIDPREENTVERLVELSDGLGPDVIFDCAGIGDTLNHALDAARRDGQVVLVAVPWQPMPLEPADWMAREVDLRVSFASEPRDWRIALDLLASGRISTEALLSETSFIELEDIQQTFEDLMLPSSQLQVVIRF